MKKYNKYDPIFKYNHLTNLMVYKDGKKKGLAQDMGVSLITDNLLSPYGINLWGTWTGLEGWELRGCTLNKKFPVENFPILQQMYGFEDADIYIVLDRTENYEHGFYFNTDTLKIRLVEYRWGDIKKDRFFNSFADFWAEVKTVKNKYGKLFPKEDNV